MGDFIRFILTGADSLSLADIERGLKEIDAEFSIHADSAAPTSGDVLYGSDIYGEVEVNHADDQVLREDIDDLREQIAELDDEGTAVVLQALDGATGMVALRLSEAGLEHYDRIDPFWDWLFDHFAGLLQVDEEGYYQGDEQVLFVPW
ncbi:MAG: hypothetical protein IT319_12595 [Anaerolineae bacterium]|nr:hypothetical protein [Anaerolineae bacterium]